NGRERGISERPGGAGRGRSAMAKPSARSPRITATLQILCAGLWLAACSGGGGGGSAAPAASPASPAAQTSSVTLAWRAAQGPVAGYSVFVQRGNGAYKHEADVPQTRATVYGEPGSTARVIVTAFDRSKAHGPNSPSSPQFTFPAANASSAGASAATAGASTSAVYYTAASQVSPLLASTDATSAATSSETPAAELAGGALVWQAGHGFRRTYSAAPPL